jgi:hypothetical protein
LVKSRLDVDRLKIQVFIALVVTVGIVVVLGEKRGASSA